jgi:hypothetical protein
MSHTTQLAIRRATEGIEEFRACIKALASDGLEEKLFDKFMTARNDPLIDRIEHRIVEAVNKHFEANSNAAKEFIRASEFAQFSLRQSKDRARGQFESSIAKAKDTLEEAIGVLEMRIAKLQGEDLGRKKQATASTDAGRQEVPKQENRPPIIHLKPTFMGMGIDLNELWRRLRGR